MEIKTYKFNSLSDLAVDSQKFNSSAFLKQLKKVKELIEDKDPQAFAKHATDSEK